MPFDQRRAAVVTAGFAAFLNLYPPQALLPQLEQAFGVASGGATVTVAAGPLSVALLAPFAGIVTDIVGRARMMAIAMTGLGLATILSGTRKLAGRDAVLAFRVRPLRAGHRGRSGRFPGRRSGPTTRRPRGWPVHRGHGAGRFFRTLPRGARDGISGLARGVLRDRRSHAGPAAARDTGHAARRASARPVTAARSAARCRFAPAQPAPGGCIRASDSDCSSRSSRRSPTRPCISLRRLTRSRPPRSGRCSQRISSGWC